MREIRKHSTHTYTHAQYASTVKSSTDLLSDLAYIWKNPQPTQNNQPPHHKYSPPTYSLSHETSEKCSIPKAHGSEFPRFFRKHTLLAAALSCITITTAHACSRHPRSARPIFKGKLHRDRQACIIQTHRGPVCACRNFPSAFPKKKNLSTSGRKTESEEVKNRESSVDREVPHHDTSVRGWTFTFQLQGITGSVETTPILLFIWLCKKFLAVYGERRRYTGDDSFFFFAGGALCFVPRKHRIVLRDMRAVGEKIRVHDEAFGNFCGIIICMIR